MALYLREVVELEYLELSISLPTEDGVVVQLQEAVDDSR